jgi:hypothetical protein
MSDKTDILQTGRTAAFGVCAALLAMQLSLSAQTLVNRYSFHETDDGQGNVGATIHDSVGKADGTLPQGGAFSGGQLALTVAGGDQFVNLPPGILSNYTAVSIEAWVTSDVNLPWASMLYSFGNTDANGLGEDYIFGSLSRQYACISGVDPGYNGEQGTSQGPALDNAPVHFTAVYDPPAGYVALYTNGVLQSINQNVTTPLSAVQDVESYIGRSPYSGDPYGDYTLSEFRIWNGALNAFQVAGSDVAGPSTVGLDPGAATNVQFVVPFYQLAQGTHEQGRVLILTAQFTNAIDISSLGSVIYSSGNTNILTVNSNGVISAIGQGASTIQASYGGVSSSQTITVVPPASILANRYSFSETDDGAGNNNATVHDSVGGAAGNGTLPNGGIFTGSQLAIAAASDQYVNLPAGILTNYVAVTIEVWVSSPSANPMYSMLYSFGDTDSGGAGEYYIFGSLTRNYTCITATDPGYSAEQGASGGNFGGVTNCHFTAVYNPAGGDIALYQGAKLVGKNLNVTDQMSVVRDLTSYIGRSPYTGDPYGDLLLNEFRIYNGALTSQGVAISDLAGPDAIPAAVTNGAGPIVSLSFQLPTSLEWLGAASPKLLANYATLTNYDLVANSVFPLVGLSVASSDTNVISIASDNSLHAVGLGAATIVGSYQGVTNTTLVTVHRSPNSPVLMHRYSFVTDASDSVGGPGWAGTPVGNASISGGQLLIPNTPFASPAMDYLQLPAGILTNAVNGIGTNFNDPAVTVEAWVTIYPGQFTWANLFDFGSQDASNDAAYDIHVAVHANPSDTIIGISDSDNANADYQDWDGGSGSALDGSTNLHVVAVFNPPGGYVAIYTNGGLMGEDSKVTISMAGVSAVLNKIGADNWPDPGMQGSVAEFRIYNGVLSPDEVLRTQSLGPKQVLVIPPPLSASISKGNLILTWPETATGFTPEYKASLGASSWTKLTSPAAQLVGGQWQVSVPVSGSAQFFRLAQ